MCISVTVVQYVASKRIIDRFSFTVELESIMHKLYPRCSWWSDVLSKLLIFCQPASLHGREGGGAVKTASWLTVNTGWICLFTSHLVNYFTNWKEIINYSTHWIVKVQLLVSSLIRPHYAGGAWKSIFTLKTHQMFWFTLHWRNL